MNSRAFSASRLTWLLPCLLLSWSVSVLAKTPPVVVASIKPLQLIAAALTDGVSKPALVMSASQDPHHAALRPSERRNLQQAELVLWAGPLLEIPLEGVIGSLKVPVITAQKLPQIMLLQVAGVLDPHLWLDSRNARVISTALQSALVELDPSNAERYAANYARFLTQLDKVDADIQAALVSFKTQAWAVSHNAFRYFAQQHGLLEPLALTDTSNNTLGVRSALAVREQIAKQNIRCLLTEPSENHMELASLLDGKQLHMVTADGLGIAIEPSADAYVQLLLQISSALQTCMGAQHE